MNGSASRRAVVLGLCVLVLALVPRLLGFTDPWSTVAPDYVGAFGSNFTGGPVSHLVTHGFAQRGGLPYVWGVELASGEWVFADYTHHPATFMWLCALSVETFGRHEWAMRLVPLIGSLFSIAALARLGFVAGGARVALVCGVLAATLPFSARHGMQCWTEGTIVGTTAMVLAHHLVWLRTGARRELVRAALWVLIGTAFDWTALFVLPALGLHALFASDVAPGVPRKQRTLWLVLLPALGAVPVLLHALHLALVTHAGFFRSEGEATVSGILGLPEGLGLDEFLVLQWWYALDGFTASGLALAGVGLAVAQRALGPHGRTVALVGLTPGVVYVALFPGRSFNHDFFQMVALPGVVLLGAAAIEYVSRRSRSVGALALAVVACHGLWVVRAEYVHHRDDTLRRAVETPAIAELLADERVLILANTNGIGSFLPFHARGQVRDTFNDVGALVSTLEEARARLHPDWRLVFVMDRSFVDFLPGQRELAEALQAIAPSEVVDLGTREVTVHELLARGR
jgi:hypothetical protein